MANPIETLERRQLRSDIPQFKAGDTVRVHFQVIEGERRRVQVFEGIVIKRQGSGVRETFTVRKQSFGVGVERTFPVHSPKIERIEVLKGPQGTLFGKNTSAGVINVISKAPEFDFGLTAEQTFTNYQGIESSASVTGGTALPPWSISWSASSRSSNPIG